MIGAPPMEFFFFLGGGGWARDPANIGNSPGTSFLDGLRGVGEEEGRRATARRRRAMRRRRRTRGGRHGERA
eukprot:391994-Pyramimonas_sp.AAC.1